MFFRLVVQVVAFVALQAAALFLGAGTARWPAGWVFLALMGGGAFAIGLHLLRHDPALLAERLKPVVQKEQAGWDRALMAALYPLWFVWLGLMGADALRRHADHARVPLQAAAAFVMALAFWGVGRVFAENSFAAPVVRVGRACAAPGGAPDHRVCSTGPYRVVRHPMYACVVPLLVAIPVLLGSWLGLGGTFVIVAALAGRAVLEERLLAQALPGYADYMRTVRWRLVPGVW